MTQKVLDTMMLTIMWADRDELCDELRGERCMECPYYLEPSICNKITTHWILHRGAKVYKEYFKSIKKEK
jgi:hypothetical protein